MHSPAPGSIRPCRSRARRAPSPRRPRPRSRHSSRRCDASQVPRVVRRAVRDRLGEEGRRELREVRLADEHEARRPQPRREVAVGLLRVLPRLEQRHAAVERDRRRCGRRRPSSGTARPGTGHRAGRRTPRPCGPCRTCGGSPRSGTGRGARCERSRRRPARAASTSFDADELGLPDSIDPPQVVDHGRRVSSAHGDRSEQG